MLTNHEQPLCQRIILGWHIYICLPFTNNSCVNVRFWVGTVRNVRSTHRIAILLELKRVRKGISVVGYKIIF